MADIIPVECGRNIWSLCDVSDVFSLMKNENEISPLEAQYWPLCFAYLCCCFGFHGSEAPIVIKEFYSGHKQKPQNFQHHKNGRQEIAACNAQWAIPGL